MVFNCRLDQPWLSVCLSVWLAGWLAGCLSGVSSDWAALLMSMQQAGRLFSSIIILYFKPVRLGRWYSGGAFFATCTLPVLTVPSFAVVFSAELFSSFSSGFFGAAKQTTFVCSFLFSCSFPLRFVPSLTWQLLSYFDVKAHHESRCCCRCCCRCCQGLPLPAPLPPLLPFLTACSSSSFMLMQTTFHFYLLVLSQNIGKRP